jgi:aspartyl/glutamyl-tRNA(Asn/Gln) amidotransferase C subunit
MSSLDRAAVARIANLARIEVPEADQDRLAAELSGILGWIEQLGEVDTATTEPLRAVMPLPQRWRADEVADGGRAARSGQRALRPRRLLRRAEGGRVAPMADLTRLTLEAARDGLRRKEFSARELAEAHVAAVEGARPLNAFITETPEQALRMAAAADERLARGEGGLLEGLPVAIKDLFCTKGVLTTAGSASSTASSRPTSRRSPVSSGRPAPSASARRTSTSSPWARRT